MAESTSEEQTPTAAAAASSLVATTPGKKGSVADRVAWLQNAFNKDNSNNTPSKRDIGLESSTSVSDRKRWMEEEAFRKHLEEKGMDAAGTSHASVVAERKRWLDEQAERNRLENEKNQVNKQGTVGSPRGAARSSSATQLTTAEAETEAKEENETTNAGDAAAANQGVAEDMVEEAVGSDTKDDEEAVDATDGEAKDETEDKNDIKEDTANEKEETTNEDDKPEEEKDGAEPPLVEEDADEEVAPADNDNDTDTDKEKAAEASAALIAASKPTRPSSQDPPIKTTASTMMRATETTGTGGSAMPCLFSSPVFAQQRDQMEFFLPAACSCPKCRAELAEAATAAAENGDGGNGNTAAERADPTSLKTILRPWQVEFLTSQGITTAQALVNVEKDAESRQKLCKQMKRWRKERDLPAKTISCLMACRIWAKTSEEALKNAK